ncbi:MAG TPA: XRE family transcriptional regulator [Anaerolineales bacterium]|nr:XRE family transcriptional regulator [Anaerolineales bacterium]
MAIGERIRLARKASGMSMRALAEKAGVSPMAVSKYERGMDVPSSGVLVRLGRATGVRVEYFFRPAAMDVELRAFRRHSRLGVKRQAAVTAQVQEWLERYLEAAYMFGEPSGESLPRFPASTFDGIELAAEKVRDAWSLGLDPIENLVEVLEDHSVAVGLVEGSEKFDACTFEADGAVVIAIKRGLPGDRQRFNLAHELGHLILDVRGEMSEEAAAHRFAGALLVPRRQALAELGESRTTLDVWELLLLKQKYGLSMQGWIHRALDLGVIDQSAAATLFKEFRWKGWHRTEPGEPFPAEEPSRLKLLVARALAEDMISPSRAAELLGGALDEVKRMDFQGDSHAHALARG